MTDIKSGGEAHHGSLNYEELADLGIEPEEVIDFSSNVNPFGPPKILEEAIRAVDSAHYPDRNANALREGIAMQDEVRKEHVFVGNGSSEIIWLLQFLFRQQAGNVLILEPTFGEYARCAALFSSEVLELRSRQVDGFLFEKNHVDAQLSAGTRKLVFLCNPNNPSGVRIEEDHILDWVRSYPDTTFVVDEAYHRLSDQESGLAKSSEENLILLRSLTKDYSIAGLRLGYCIADPEIVRELARTRPAWNVNSLAQAAGLAALQTPHFLKDSMRRLHQEKKELTKKLERLGFKPLPSSTHYFLMEVGNGAQFRDKLLQGSGVQVRDCASFGLPSMVRISTRGQEDNERLIKAIASLVL